MLRLMTALAILLACGIAPLSYAQDDCDEEALAAGECGGEAVGNDDANDADGASADSEGVEQMSDEAAGEDQPDVDSDTSSDESAADSEPLADDENVEPMAGDESGDEDAAADDGADLSDAAEGDEAADEDTAAAGAEEDESDDDFDTEIAAATDDDDDDSVDAASGDDLLSTPQAGESDAPRTPSGGPSTPATQRPAPPVTQTPAPPPTPSAGTPTPAAQANCAGGGFRRVPGARCGTAPAPAPAPAGPVSIYVGNLSWTMTEDDLKNLFEVHGTVSSAQIVRDKVNGNRSRGFGFVTMPDRAEAETAISLLNESEVQGRKIVVNDSQPRSGR